LPHRSVAESHWPGDPKRLRTYCVDGARRVPSPRRRTRPGSVAATPPTKPRPDVKHQLGLDTGIRHSGTRGTLEALHPGAPGDGGWTGWESECSRQIRQTQASLGSPWAQHSPPRRSATNAASLSRLGCPQPMQNGCPAGSAYRPHCRGGRCSVGDIALPVFFAEGRAAAAGSASASVRFLIIRLRGSLECHGLRSQPRMAHGDE
jgi:hypothetical protein